MFTVLASAIAAENINIFNLGRLNEKYNFGVVVYWFGISLTICNAFAGEAIAICGALS